LDSRLDQPGLMIQGIFRKDKGRAITHERIRREKRLTW